MVEAARREAPTMPADVKAIEELVTLGMSCLVFVCVDLKRDIYGKGGLNAFEFSVRRSQRLTSLMPPDE